MPKQTMRIVYKMNGDIVALRQVKLNRVVSAITNLQAIKATIMEVKSES